MGVCLLDVVHFEHDLDAPPGTFLLREAERMVLVEIRAPVQSELNGAVRERRVASRPFGKRLEAEHADVEIQ